MAQERGCVFLSSSFNFSSMETGPSAARECAFLSAEAIKTPVFSRNMTLVSPYAIHGVPKYCNLKREPWIRKSIHKSMISVNSPKKSPHKITRIKSMLV